LCYFNFFERKPQFFKVFQLKLIVVAGRRAWFWINLRKGEEFLVFWSLALLIPEKICDSSIYEKLFGIWGVRKQRTNRAGYKTR